MNKKMNKKLLLIPLFLFSVIFLLSLVMACQVPITIVNPASGVTDITGATNWSISLGTASNCSSGNLTRVMILLGANNINVTVSYRIGTSGSWTGWINNLTNTTVISNAVVNNTKLSTNNPNTSNIADKQAYSFNFSLWIHNDTGAPKMINSSVISNVDVDNTAPVMDIRVEKAIVEYMKAVKIDCSRTTDDGDKSLNFTFSLIKPDGTTKAISKLATDSTPSKYTFQTLDTNKLGKYYINCSASDDVNYTTVSELKEFRVKESSTEGFEIELEQRPRINIGFIFIALGIVVLLIIVISAIAISSKKKKRR